MKNLSALTEIEIVGLLLVKPELYKLVDLTKLSGISMSHILCEHDYLHKVLDTRMMDEEDIYRVTRRHPRLEGVLVSGVDSNPSNYLVGG